MQNLMTNCRKLATLLAVAACAFLGIDQKILDAQSAPPPSLDLPAAAPQTDDLLAPQENELPEPVQEAAKDPLPAAPDLSVPQDPSAPVPPPPIEQDEQMPEDYEFMMRGPLHEAFAQAWQRDPATMPTISEQPPEPISELPPEVKPEGTNVEWIPGYWAWDDQDLRYLWISGVWRDIPLGKKWIAGNWNPNGDGWSWTPGFWSSADVVETQFVPEAPPASIDNGPSTEAPGDDYFYVPGNWVWHNGHYVWQSGYWCPRIENRVWVPSQYIVANQSYIYCPGYWDYPLEDRGILFAPVYFTNPVYVNVGWNYRPSCVVTTGVSFFTHLFTHRNYGYCFGDYYDYHSYGYRPWAYTHHYAGCYDPLFTYYSYRGYRYHGTNEYLINHIYKKHHYYHKHKHHRPHKKYVHHHKQKYGHGGKGHLAHGKGHAGKGKHYHSTRSEPISHRDHYGSLYKDVAKKTSRDREYRTDLASVRRGNRGNAQNRRGREGRDQVAGNNTRRSLQEAAMRERALNDATTRRDKNQGNANRGNRGNATAGNANRGNANRGSANRGDSRRENANRENRDANRKIAQRGNSTRGTTEPANSNRGNINRGNANRGNAVAGNASRGNANRNTGNGGKQPRDMRSLVDSANRGQSSRNGRLNTPAMRQQMQDGLRRLQNQNNNRKANPNTANKPGSRPGQRVQNQFAPRQPGSVSRSTPKRANPTNNGVRSGGSAAGMRRAELERQIQQRVKQLRQQNGNQVTRSRVPNRGNTNPTRATPRRDTNPGIASQRQPGNTRTTPQTRGNRVNVPQRSGNVVRNPSAPRNRGQRTVNNGQRSTVIRGQSGNTRVRTSPQTGNRNFGRPPVKSGVTRGTGNHSMGNRAAGGGAYRPGNTNRGSVNRGNSSGVTRGTSRIPRGGSSGASRGMTRGSNGINRGGSSGSKRSSSGFRSGGGGMRSGGSGMRSGGNRGGGRGGGRGRR